MEKNNNMKMKKTYMYLDKRMYSVLEPKTLKHPETVKLNESLCKELEMDSTFLQGEEGVRFLSGTTNTHGPLFAQAYAGHQYGHFTNLGDGRAMILGEVETKDGKLVDLQLKGSGMTPYSRRGDGKATLYSVLREYLISEAMHSLGIPTTRSLSVVKTNELIQRTELEKGGILCRTASSHIRVGTFQYAKALQDDKLIKELSDYTINRHYKNLIDAEKKYKLFLREVIKQQAILIAKWQSIGFIHGVMNTDNMTISGETIDYGPCAFMNEYKPSTVFSSIDQNGRYAYKEQPFIGSWNLARFAETILTLLDDDPKKAIDIANEELQKYGDYFKAEYYRIMARKVGIEDPLDEEKLLIDDLLILMEKHKSDYTNTFRLLTLDDYQSLPFYSTNEWKIWFQKWTRFLGTRQVGVTKRVKLMEESNPVIIPRNLLVEEALKKASKEDDYTLFNELLEKLKHPYDYVKQHDSKYVNPQFSSKPYITYCGT